MWIVEKILKKEKIEYKVLEYKSESLSEFAKEASEKLWIKLDKIFKTLIITNWESKFFVCVIPSHKRLALKKLEVITWIKKLSLSDRDSVEKLTWYKIWAISPIWQKKKLTTFIDIEAKNHETFFISSWIKWLELEISPIELCKLISGTFYDVSIT